MAVQKGSRNQLGEAFVADLYADWQANGAQTITRVREERPQDYLKVVASILPKDVNLNVSRFDHMTSDELNAEILRLDAEMLELTRGASATEH